MMASMQKDVIITLLTMRNAIPARIYMEDILVLYATRQTRGTRTVLTKYSDFSFFKCHKMLQIYIQSSTRRCVFIRKKEDGRSGGIRTPDLLLPKQPRYQTALHSDFIPAPPVNASAWEGKSGEYPEKCPERQSLSGKDHSGIDASAVPGSSEVIPTAWARVEASAALGSISSSKIWFQWVGMVRPST